MGVAWLLRLPIPTPCRRRCPVGRASRLNDRYVSALFVRAWLSLARFMCVCLFPPPSSSFVVTLSPCLSFHPCRTYVPSTLLRTCRRLLAILPVLHHFTSLNRDFSSVLFFPPLLSTIFSSSFSSPAFLVPFFPSFQSIARRCCLQFVTLPFRPLPSPSSFPPPPPAGPARWPQRRVAEQTCPHA